MIWNPTVKTDQTKPEDMVDLPRAKPHRRAIAPLWLRIICIAMAVVFLVTAAITGLNLYAINSYNEATATLNETIKLAKKPGTDPKTIELRQRQTDELFDRVGKLSPVLVGSVRHAISTNTKVSTRLTTKTRQRIATIEEARHKGALATKARSSNQADGDGAGLTDEQRHAVEQTLKANQPSSSNSQNQNKDESSDTQHKDIKPW